MTGYFPRPLFSTETSYLSLTVLSHIEDPDINLNPIVIIPIYHYLPLIITVLPPPLTHPPHPAQNQTNIHTNQPSHIT